MSVSHPVESLPLSPPRPATQRAVASASLRPFWERISMKDAPGWLVSLGIHLAVIVVLLTFKFHIDAQQKDASIFGALENLEAEQFFESISADQVGTTEEVKSLTAPSVSTSSTIAMGAQSVESVQRNVQQRVEENLAVPEVAIRDDAVAPREFELTGTVDLPGGSVENLAQGSGGGVEGAIDRLAWEITQSLRQSKTTVIWLFDQSLSLKERRNSIADRFEMVYKQLESLGEGGKGALQTVVASYGKELTIITDKPTDDVKSVIPKVRAIPNDPSGLENVFGSVNTLATRFSGERRNGRNLLIFIITDEKGDDADRYLEETVLKCRKAGIKVYTVGNAAFFGREQHLVDWKYPDGAVDRLPVDSGPETVEPEALAMGFWGGRGPDLHQMSSGYGPYGLTRLCKETGGLYFIAMEESRIKFSPAVMRTYEPDYRPIREYQMGLNKNKAKMSLVVASKKSKTENLENIRDLPRSFVAYNDSVLKDRLTDAQKPAAEMGYRIEELLTDLSQGEKDRDRVTEPRWRAAYDLAMGRILAMKVRAAGYNQMLADMKGQPKTFEKKDSNEWSIVPSKTINAGQTYKKMEKQATTYLKRVMDEHPDTPWAMLAEREMSIPMGWDWQEHKNPNAFPPNTSPAEAKRRIQLAEDNQKTAPKKAATPPPPPREKPKL